MSVEQKSHQNKEFQFYNRNMLEKCDLQGYFLIYLWSISPTFYARFLSYESFARNFFALVLLWRKNIGAKDALKMLVKLTPDYQTSF
jgi:hypothetical protein